MACMRACRSEGDGRRDEQWPARCSSCRGAGAPPSQASCRRITLSYHQAASRRRRLLVPSLPDAQAHQKPRRRRAVNHRNVATGVVAVVSLGLQRGLSLEQERLRLGAHGWEAHSAHSPPRTHTHSTTPPAIPPQDCFKPTY